MQKMCTNGRQADKMLLHSPVKRIWSHVPEVEFDRIDFFISALRMRAHVRLSLLFISQGGCGGIIRDFQFISSPGYPDRMIRDELCVWVFYSPLSRARLEITSINVSSYWYNQYITFPLTILLLEPIV
ncbi:hypothetical protein FBUS_06268 [Fasciolopsis buskii]|uniref:CUB domain-containing protein n=1 Tax=Fasciolopsis buskii TaxID=27845 RepID=A0A8E0RYN4_9TREM|nr:hypothetical protein FBUS_06268 [Fasciolopsis buski]